MHMVAEKELPFNNDTIHDVNRSEISSNNLKKILRSAPTDGVSVCVRTDHGSSGRGGYLFHYTENNDMIQVEYFPFNPEDETQFDSWNELGRFVKHVTGEEWDKEMYQRSLQIVTRIE